MFVGQLFPFSLFILGVFSVMYDGYLANAEDDVDGAVPVIIKTTKGLYVVCVGTRKLLNVPDF